MKMTKIITVALAVLLSGCVVPQHPPQTQSIVDRAPPAKAAYIDGTTYPYHFNTPITGYQNPALGASRTLRIDRLKSLGSTTNFFKDGDSFSSSMEFVLGGNHRIHGTLVVRSGKKMKSTGVLGYSSGYGNCLYQLSPMGEDENHFRYYKPVLRQKDMVRCDSDRIVRIEQREDGSLRVSSHNIVSGVEQWAGMFYREGVQLQ